MERKKIQISLHNIVGQEHNWKTDTTQPQDSYKATLTRQCGISTRIHRSMEKNKEHRYRPTEIESTDL